MSLICAISLPLIAPLTGCRSSGDGSEAAVVATTTQVADIARNVAGDELEVHGILAPNSDPHEYEPRPSDATAVAGAEVIVTSGGETDEWVEELVESSGTEAEIVTLLDEVPVTRTDEGGELDPHWWQDPRNAEAASEAIGAALARAYPEEAAAHSARAAEYAGEVRKADREIAECMALLYDADRKLVTSHDSLGYFADRYDIEVVGSAVPALSTQAQPSSGETAELVGLLSSEHVRAVFAEAGLPSDLERAIADDAGVRLGAPLYADSLGEPGTPGDTYIGALEWNARALFDGFTRGKFEPCPKGAG